MSSSVLKTVIAIISITTGSALLVGCTTTQVQYITEPLPLPSRPVLPSMSSDDLSCLSADAYRRLTERNRLRRQYAERLETIIRSTHKDEQD